MANAIDLLYSFVKHSERYYISFMRGEARKRESRGKSDMKNIKRNISQQYYLQITYINAPLCIKGKLNTATP